MESGGFRASLLALRAAFKALDNIMVTDPPTLRQETTTSGAELSEQRAANISEEPASAARLGSVRTGRWASWWHGGLPLPSSGGWLGGTGEQHK